MPIEKGKELDTTVFNKMLNKALKMSRMQESTRDILLVPADPEHRPHSNFSSPLDATGYYQ